MIKIITEFLEYRKNKEKLEAQLLLDQALVVDEAQILIVPYEVNTSIKNKVNQFITIKIDYKAIKGIIEKESVANHISKHAIGAQVSEHINDMIRPHSPWTNKTYLYK